MGRLRADAGDILFNELAEDFKRALIEARAGWAERACNKGIWVRTFAHAAVRLGDHLIGRDQ